jgi:hypothetical protein
MSNEALSENARPPKEKPFQFSMRAMFIGVTVFAVVLGILAWWVRGLLQDARRAQCSSQIKHLAYALHNYHDVYRVFPPACTHGPDGKPWHSWRVLILPFVDEPALAKKYRFDEPWDGPDNRKLHATAIPLYRCPMEHRRVPASTANYLAIVGPGTAWPGAESMVLDDFTDGTSNCILLIEVANSGIHWLEPRDLKLEDLPLVVNPKSGKGISSNHVRGAHVCFADGSVHFLPNDLAADTLRKMILVNDGEEVPWDEISPDR